MRLAVLIIALSALPATASEQLRAQYRSDLHRAGVPDACVDRLGVADLAQVKGLLNDDAQMGVAPLWQDARLRDVARRACPDLVTPDL
ncbi:MAG: hypothetical protein AAFR47_17540 [Pseudomonadota bacterium]